MRTKLFGVCIAVSAIAIACGGGSNSDNQSSSGNGNGSSAAPIKTPNISPAPAGGINRPKDGVYTYDYSSLLTNAATPDSPPQRSKPNALLQSAIAYEGDVTVTSDKTTEGSAVSTLRQRYGKDGVFEIGFKLKTDKGNGGCTYDTPNKILPVPIAKTVLPTQTYAGKGSTCEGKRTISVERKTTTTDAGGVTWQVWLIRVDTQGTSTGLTKKTVDMRWFSPDLGKDIRSEQKSDYINSSGGVSAHTEATLLLHTYPGAS